MKFIKEIVFLTVKQSNLFIYYLSTKMKFKEEERI